MSDRTLSLITPGRLMVAASAVAAVLLPAWLLSGGGAVEEDIFTIGATPFDMVAMEPLTDALAAPLFNALRQVPVSGETDGNMSQAAEDAASTPAAPPPALVGLIVGRGAPGIALAKGADGQTQLLHSGDVIDGWQVGAITAGGATFTMNGQVERASLAFAKPPAGTSPDAAPPSGPDPSATPDQPLPAGRPQ